jgi:hypothetical protein
LIDCDPVASEKTLHPAPNELKDFHCFIGDKLSDPSSNLSPEQALVEWRDEHPLSDECAESAADLQKALDEADRGQGDLLDDVITTLRRKHQLPNAAPVE